ncbi:MAG TPA: hypothetical protein DEH25_15670 [Chloroflexi bacterium]|nr:hypothetical protein [Chloroflexota bacterium]
MGSDFFGGWKQRAQHIKSEIYALYLAYKDPRVPWYARVFAALVIAYAFSPIDLIPDPIPILGYLDDLLLLPVGIWLAIKLIPPEVLAENRQRAQTDLAANHPVSRVAAIVIIMIWLLLAGAFIAWGLRWATRLDILGTTLRLPSGRI